MESLDVFEESWAGVVVEVSGGGAGNGGPVGSAAGGWVAVGVVEVWVD